MIMLSRRMLLTFMRPCAQKLVGFSFAATPEIVRTPNIESDFS